MVIEFISLNKLNISLAKKIQEQTLTLEYIKYINSMEKTIEYSWIVYNNNEPIGITGFNKTKNETNSVWLNNFGVLPEFRNKGFGKKILIKTIEVAKQRNYKSFKVIASKTHCPIAIKIFDKIMDIKENYTQTPAYYIYTKWLT